MRAIIQRVINAKVTVTEELISSIGRGICVLVGICRDDTDKDIEYIVRKLLNLRIFENESQKRWDKSTSDMGFEILCVSQFTLHSVMKGNRLDFHLAMNPEKAPVFYEKFMNELKKAYKPELVKDGKFGALMEVHIVNDGPVTITIDSRKKDSETTAVTDS